YKMPLVYHRQKLDTVVLEKLKLQAPKEADLTGWRALSDKVDSSRGDQVDIGFVGKYVDLQDAYKSVYEALRHAGYANGVQVKIHRIEAEDLEADALDIELSNVDGILIPGGFGSRGIEGKIEAARIARKN